MDELTPRQRQVAELVARGLSAKAIARRIGISHHTAHKHVQDAASRLPLPGRPRYRLTLWYLTMADAPES